MVVSVVYRVTCLPNGKCNLYAWGMDADNALVDAQRLDFKHADMLPDWLQRKLAVLMSLNPNVNNAEVPAVGKRISTNVYWVYPGEGEHVGNDAGGQS